MFPTDGVERWDDQLEDPRDAADRSGTYTVRNLLQEVPLKL